MPFYEIELELKQGKVADLFEMAKSLAVAAPIHFAVKSKADRGYALIRAKKPEAAKAGPITIPPEADAWSGFQIIASPSDKAAKPLPPVGSRATRRRASLSC